MNHLTDRHEPWSKGATVGRDYLDCLVMWNTLASTGSVVTTLSVMGTTIVKGR